MTDTSQNAVLGRITPQPIRRVMAAGFTGMLGLMLLLIAGTTPPRDLPYLAILLVCGVGSLWLSWRIWQATGRVLELTMEELREEDGETLCRVDDIANVDRGFFAFKPAGGFVIRLKTRAPRAYVPGLWWRSGRTLMVGGATAGGEAKSVADLIRVLLAERELRADS